MGVYFGEPKRFVDEGEENRIKILAELDDAFDVKFYYDENTDGIEIVAGAYFDFTPDNYNIVKRVLIKKYGDPTMSKTSILQNNMGAKFFQEKISWTDPKGIMIVHLSRYGDSVTEGVGGISNVKRIVKGMREDEDKINKAAGKF